MAWALVGDVGAREGWGRDLKRSEVGWREGRWLVLERSTLCSGMSRGGGVGARGFGGGWARCMRPGRRWERCAFFSTEAAGSPSLCSLVSPGLSPAPRVRDQPWRWSGPSWAYSPCGGYLTPLHQPRAQWEDGRARC